MSYVCNTFLSWFICGSWAYSSVCVLNLFLFSHGSTTWIPGCNGLACSIVKGWITSDLFSLLQHKRILEVTDFQYTWSRNPFTIVTITWIGPHSVQCIASSSYFCYLRFKNELDNSENNLGKLQHLSNWISFLFHLSRGPFFHPLYSEEVTLEGFLWAQLEAEMYLKTCRSALCSWEFFV